LPHYYYYYYYYPVRKLSWFEDGYKEILSYCDAYRTRQPVCSWNDPLQRRWSGTFMSRFNDHDDVQDSRCWSIIAQHSVAVLLQRQSRASVRHRLYRV